MRSDWDVKITIALGIAIFLILAVFKGPKFSEDVLSVASTAISATVAIRFVYVKWLWKCLPFVVRRVPLLEGEWEGDLESTGNDRTPVDRKKIKIKVKIVQPDIFSVNVLRITDESQSRSFSETLSSEGVDGTFQLLYSYLSEPKATVRDRSPISYGTARLRTSLSSLDHLEGDYWTDQKTTGIISLQRKKT